MANVFVDIEFEKELQKGEVTNISLMTNLRDAGYPSSKVQIVALTAPVTKAVYGARLTYKHDNMSDIEKYTLLGLLDGLYGVVGYVPPVVEPPPIPPTPDISSGFLVQLRNAAGELILDANGQPQYVTAEAQVEQLALTAVGLSDIWLLRTDAAGVALRDANGNYVYETVGQAAARQGWTLEQVSAFATEKGLWMAPLVDRAGNLMLDENGLPQFLPIREIAGILGVPYDIALSLTTQMVVKQDAANNPYLYNGTVEVGVLKTMVVLCNAAGVPQLLNGELQFVTFEEGMAATGLSQAEFQALIDSHNLWAQLDVNADGTPKLVNGELQYTSLAQLMEDLSLSADEAAALSSRVVEDVNGDLVPGVLVKQTTTLAAASLLGVSEAKIMALSVVPPMQPGIYWRSPSSFNISVMKVKPDVDQGALVLQTRVTMLADGTYTLEKTASLEWMDETLFPSSVYTHTRIRVTPTASAGLPLNAVYTFPKNCFQIETSPGVTLQVNLLNDLVVGPPNVGVALTDFWINALGEGYLCKTNRNPFTDYVTASTTTPRL